MSPAIMAGLAAGALWGLTFLAPRFIGEASAGELVILRYCVYGSVSIAYLWWIGYPFGRLSWRDWARIVAYGALGNSIYYLLMASSVLAGGPALTALVIGTLPVMFSVVANIRRPTVRWWKIAIATVPIIAGMALLAAQDADDATLQFAPMGVALALAAMSVWLVYALSNAAYLTSGAAPGPMVWSALVGVGTLLTLPVLAVGAAVGEGGIFALGIGQYWPVLLCGLVLGLLSSWLATWLWNVASSGMSPVALGYLIVSETVFALIYAFALDWRLPGLHELASVVLLVGGTLLGLRLARL